MKRNKSLLFLALCLSLAVSLSAQLSSRETGAITGVVRDEEGRFLPGVSITVTSPSLMGTRSYITNDEGAFRLPLLPVGTYSLVATISGFKTIKREGIIVNLGATVSISIEMMPTSIVEEVTVIGESPAVDVKSSKIDQVFKRDLIQNLPIARNLQTVVAMTPGTVSAYNVKGGTQANTTFQVDGLAANDPTNQRLGIRMDFNVMEEVEVITGGLPAEAGETTGAFVNVVTKQGGNKFTGTVQAYVTNEDLSTVLIPKEQLKALNLGPPTVAAFDYDFSAGFGGPIIKDKLWFFFNGRYAPQNFHGNFIPTTINTPVGTYNYGAYDDENKTYGGFLKLSAQLTKSLRFSLMGNLERWYYNIFEGSRWYMPLECSYKADPWGTYAATGVLSWMASPNTFIEARGGWHKNDSPLPLYKPELTDVPYMSDWITGYLFGTGWRPNEWVGRPSVQASVHLMSYQDNILGADHELKVGIEYVTGEDRWAWWKNEPLYMAFADSNPYVWEYYGYPRSWYGDGYVGWRTMGTSKETSENAGRNVRLGAYFQDNITIKQRLTINAGIRIDRTSGSIPPFTKSASGGIAEEIGQRYLVPLFGVNPFSAFTDPGVKGMIKFSPISPRLGITYDVFGNGKTALKLNIGRYSDHLSVGQFSSIHPVNWGEVDFYWWDENHNYRADLDDYYEYAGPDWWSPLSMKRDVWTKLIFKDIKCPYDDQIMAAIEHELLPNLKVSLSYMFKKKTNIIDDVPYDPETGKFHYNPEKNPYWVKFTTTVPKVDDFEARKVEMYFLKNGAPDLVLALANVPEANRKYSGLELSFHKRMDKGWQLGGSLTLSKTWGNMHGGYNDTLGKANAFNNANWFVNSDGRTYEDRPLIIKLFGTFNLPLGLYSSFVYSYNSGTPWGRGITVYAPLKWRVANDINPAFRSYWVLTETIGTRRYQPYQNLDVRLEKRFNFGFGNLGLFIDVLNLMGNYFVNVDQDPGGSWAPVDDNTSVGSYTKSGTYKKVTGINNLSRVFKLSLRFTF